MGVAFPVLMPSDRRPTIENTAREFRDFRRTPTVAARGMEIHQFGPEARRGGRSIGPADRNRRTWWKWQEINHLDAKHFPERGGVTAEPHVVGWIDDPAEERHHQPAAAAHIADEIARAIIANQIEIRHQHQSKSAQIIRRPDEIGGDVAIEQGAIVRLNLIHQAQLGGRLGRQLERPPRLPIDDDADVRLDPRAADDIEPLQLGA